MKLVPRARHFIAGTVLVALAAVYSYLALLDDRISPAQASIVTVALKEHQGDLFAHDPVYGSRGLWRVHTPVFQSLLKLVLVPTDYADPSLPFRLMVPAVVLVYLCGMYALLYRQCSSWSVAVFVAGVSTTVTYTLGGSYWGMGSLASITPEALYLAAVPLILAAFLRYDDPRQRTVRPGRLFLVFGVIGLLGNLDLPSAGNLTLVLLIVYLGRRRFALSAWPIALGCALSAIVGAMPYALYYLALRLSAAGGGADVSPAAVKRAFDIANVVVLYPDVLKAMLNWLVLSVVAVVVAVLVLNRTERFRARDTSTWVWFAAGALVVATVFHGLSQLIGKLTGAAPPIIDFIHASRLVMLPVYVLLCQAVTNMFRLARRHRGMVRWACAAMAAAWMLPSDNLRIPRYAAMDAATAFMDPDDRPRSVRRHRVRRMRGTELSAIGRWARKHTDKHAVFAVDQSEFRMLARRSIVASRNDARTIYAIAPWHLDELMKRVAGQDRLLYPGQDGRFNPEGLKFLDDLAASKEFRGAREWFVILKAKVVVEGVERLESVDPPGGDESWGKHFRLYRVRLAKPPREFPSTRPAP